MCNSRILFYKKLFFTGGEKFDYGPMYSVFNGAKMGASRWENCHLLNVIFIGCSLKEAQFNNCVFTNVFIISSDLRNSLFSNCVINENCKALTCLLSDIQFKNTRVPEKIFFFENEDIENQFIDKEATIAQMNEDIFPAQILIDAKKITNIDNSLLIKHHLYGLHSDISYYNSAEELILDNPEYYEKFSKFSDVNEDAESLRNKICDFQCLIVNNYKKQRKNR